MMAVEFIAAFAAQHRLNFVQLQLRAGQQRTILLHDVEAEADVVCAVAGERIEADGDGFYVTRLLSCGLFFNRLNDGADKGDFMHSNSGFG
jgi:hypothetical protein